MEYLIVSVPRLIWAEATAVDGGDISHLLTILPQIVAIIVAVLGVGYGFREKRLAAKQGSQTIEKNTFDQLVTENKLLIKKMELLKKSEDKFFILRTVVLKQDGGVEIIKAVEEAADTISSNEQ